MSSEWLNSLSCLPLQPLFSDVFPFVCVLQAGSKSSGQEKSVFVFPIHQVAHYLHASFSGRCSPQPRIGLGWCQTQNFDFPIRQASRGWTAQTIYRSGCSYCVSSNTVPSPNRPPKDVVPYSLPFRGTRRASERKPSGPPNDFNTVSVHGSPAVAGGWGRKSTPPPEPGPPLPPVDAVPNRLPPGPIVMPASGLPPAVPPGKVKRTSCVHTSPDCWVSLYTVPACRVPPPLVVPSR